MQAQIEDGKLVLAYSPKTRVVIVACLGLLPLGFLAYKFVQGTLTSGDTIGISVGVAILAVVAVSLYRPTKFVFDKNTQLVSWEKKHIGGATQGQASFSDITQVKRVEYRDAETQGWKVVLVLPDKEVPLTEGYIQSEKQSASIASQVSEFLGKSCN